MYTRTLKFVYSNCFIFELLNCSVYRDVYKMDSNPQTRDVYDMIFRDRLKVRWIHYNYYYQKILDQVLTKLFFQNGFFVEAGAASCDFDSVTLPFELNLNWTGEDTIMMYLSKPWNLIRTGEDTILIPSASHETSCEPVRIQFWYPQQAMKPHVESEDTVMIPSASHETSCGQWRYSYDTLIKPWNLLWTVKIQLWYPHQALKPLLGRSEYNTDIFREPWYLIRTDEDTILISSVSNDTLCMWTSEHIYDSVHFNHYKYEFKCTSTRSWYYSL